MVNINCNCTCNFSAKLRQTSMKAISGSKAIYNKYIYKLTCSDTVMRNLTLVKKPQDNI